MSEHQTNELFMKYDDIGILREEIPLLKGLRHGVGKIYFLNGRVCREITYSKGHIHGLVKEYYENGKLREEAIYTNNVKTEILKSYSPEDFKENKNSLTPSLKPTKPFIS